MVGLGLTTLACSSESDRQSLTTETSRPAPSAAPGAGVPGPVHGGDFKRNQRGSGLG